MEQEQPHPATQQADCVVVDLELQVVGAGNDAGHGSGDNYDVVGVKARPATGGGGQDHHHVVDVDRLLVNAATAGTSPKTGPIVEPDDDDDGAGKNRCAVCTEPMRGDAFGRCGHRVVCSKCMGAHEYRAVRTECEGIIPAFYDPLPGFLAYFGFFLVLGALFGVGIASGAKHLSSQVTAYVLGIFGALLFATVIWTVQKCRPYDPDVLESARLDKLYGKQSCM